MAGISHLIFLYPIIHNTTMEKSCTFPCTRTKKKLQNLEQLGICSNLQRRDRDSNPGTSKLVNGFRDRPDRPLRHLSKAGAKLILFFESIKIFFLQRRIYSDSQPFNFCRSLLISRTRVSSARRVLGNSAVAWSRRICGSL